MVALNLMMYREIAQQLENKAIKGLDRLKGKPLGRWKAQVKEEGWGICIHLLYFNKIPVIYRFTDCIR